MQTETGTFSHKLKLPEPFLCPSHYAKPCVGSHLIAKYPLELILLYEYSKNLRGKKIKSKIQEWASDPVAKTSTAHCLQNCLAIKKLPHQSTSNRKCINVLCKLLYMVLKLRGESTSSTSMADGMGAVMHPHALKPVEIMYDIPHYPPNEQSQQVHNTEQGTALLNSIKTAASLC